MLHSKPPQQMAYEIWLMNYFGTCKIFTEIQQKKRTEGFSWQTFFIQEITMNSPIYSREFTSCFGMMSQ
jgi:hypothetical protein